MAGWQSETGRGEYSPRSAAFRAVVPGPEPGARGWSWSGEVTDLSAVNGMQMCHPTLGRWDNAPTSESGAQHSFEMLGNALAEDRAFGDV